MNGHPPFALALGLLISASVSAQDLMIYPSRGQSQAQQNKDQYECHLWATQQSGYDPTRSQATATPPASPPAAPEAPVGGVFRGAGRGAALGAVGGAIAGDAGKGAAIGAGTGALIGGMRRRDQNARMEQQQQNYNQQLAYAKSQQNAQSSAQRGAYNRGMTACMQGRGYTVS